MMILSHKGKLSLEYIISFLILLALLIVLLVYSGILKDSMVELFGKFLDLVIGR